MTIDAGKRNGDREVRQLLDLSLPSPNEPMRDWQAVVLGDGIINGISQLDVWPNERINKVVEARSDL